MSAGQEHLDEILSRTRLRLRRLATVFALVFGLAMVPDVVSVVAGTTDRALSLHIGGWVMAATVIAVSAAIVRTARKASSRFAIAIGLFFVVFGAFAIAFTENWGRFAGGTPEAASWWGGISWVTMWLVGFSMVLPVEPRRIGHFALLGASMGPLALALNLWLNGLSMPEGGQGLWLGLFWPNFVAALVARMGAKFAADLRAAAIDARRLGRYRLVEKIGQGGMGEVWRAEHDLLARPAAVKLIRAETLQRAGADPSHAIARFEREAKATAALRSPHTIEVFDYGITEEGAFYYVMELLEGSNLEDLVAHGGPMSPRRAVWLLAQVCDSLAEAHARGLVHRDVKPANIFSCRLGAQRDFAKVLDFGLVKGLGEVSTVMPVVDDGPDRPTSPALTRAGTILGTPATMAPELVEGATDLDARVDVYALGCVAYWLLTGRPVFTANTAAQVMMQHHRLQPDPVDAHAPAPLPPALSSLVMRCLAKRRDARPASAGEVGTALRDIARAQGWFWVDDLIDAAGPAPNVEHSRAGAGVLDTGSQTFELVSTAQPTGHAHSPFNKDGGPEPTAEAVSGDANALGETWESGRDGDT